MATCLAWSTAPTHGWAHSSRAQHARIEAAPGSRSGPPASCRRAGHETRNAPPGPNTHSGRVSRVAMAMSSSERASTIRGGGGPLAAGLRAPALPEADRPGRAIFISRGPCGSRLPVAPGGRRCSAPLCSLEAYPHIGRTSTRTPGEFGILSVCSGGVSPEGLAHARSGAIARLRPRERQPMRGIGARVGNDLPLSAGLSFWKKGAGRGILVLAGGRSGPEEGGPRTIRRNVASGTYLAGDLSIERGIESVHGDSRQHSKRGGVAGSSRQPRYARG